MKISTKGRYALRLLIDLSLNQGDGFVALKDVAQRQNISKKYLEQIVPSLTTGGVLKTSRGFQGGYRLKKASKDITVSEILKLTEGGLSPVACLKGETNECPRCNECLTLPVWQGLDKAINDYLSGVMLEDIINGTVN